jgi:hypothetical protein
MWRGFRGGAIILFLSRGVAQPGSASALGAEGREFESLRPDQHLSPFLGLFCFWITFFRTGASSQVLLCIDDKMAVVVFHDPNVPVAQLDRAAAF